MAPSERNVKPRAQSRYAQPSTPRPGALFASAHVINLLHDRLGPLHRSRNFRLVRQSRYFKINNFMQLVVALLVVWVGVHANPGYDVTSVRSSFRSRATGCSVVLK